MCRVLLSVVELKKKCWSPRMRLKRGCFEAEAAAAGRVTRVNTSCAKRVKVSEEVLATVLEARVTIPGLALGPWPFFGDSVLISPLLVQSTSSAMHVRKSEKIHSLT